MSKQLTISASIAVLSMALFAMAVTLGHPRTNTDLAARAPLIGMAVSH